MARLKDAAPPRGCCRYRTGEYKDDGRGARWIDITQRDFSAPDAVQNTRDQMAVFLFSEIVGRIVGYQIPTLHALLSTVEPSTKLQYGTLLERGFGSIETGRIAVRTASKSILPAEELDEKFAFGGIFPIRMRTTDHEGLYTLDSQTIGVVLNDRHPYIDPEHQGKESGIPDGVIDEIPLAIANAQVQLEVKKGHLDQFLTQPQVDAAITWLLISAGLPV